MVQDLTRLEKRLYRFTTKRVKHRFQLLYVLSQLCKNGDVAVFGGVVRDIALGSIIRLKSDVDVVVRSYPGFNLYKVIEPFSPKKNSFGGYRLSLDKWYVDVWELSDTWAFKEGLVNGRGFEDLLRTTFFTWDSIVYHLNKRRLICADDYLLNLSTKILDINLEKNPNIEGSVVRALRMLIKHNARFTRSLSEYVYLHGMEIGVDRILEIDKNDRTRKALSERFLVQIFN